MLRRISAAISLFTALIVPAMPAQAQQQPQWVDVGYISDSLYVAFDANSIAGQNAIKDVTYRLTESGVVVGTKTLKINCNTGKMQVLDSWQYAPNQGYADLISGVCYRR